MHCVTRAPLLLIRELSSPIFQSLSVSELAREASVTPDQISTFSIYKGINALYWTSTHLHHLVTHSWASFLERSSFLDASKTVKIYPDDNKTFLTVSKLSRHVHIMSKLMDGIQNCRNNFTYFRTVSKCPDIFRWWQTVWTLSKVTRYFQIIPNFQMMYTLIYLKIPIEYVSKKNMGFHMAQEQ